jgi:hypothetical protein
MTPPRAADDFDIIRARMEELQRERAKAERKGEPTDRSGANRQNPLSRDIMPTREEIERRPRFSR